MKKLLATMAVAVLTLTGWTAFAQTITGTVKGDEGEILAGATLLNNKTGKYAVVENDGSFTISASAGETVTVSFFSYDDKTITVESGKKVYNVVLTLSQATQLDEAVMIGYGTTTKKEVTGSVVSLKSDSFDQGAYTDATGLLQGKVAGLTITNPNGGDPNGSFEIMLRGANTLSAGQGPLIIVDGVVGADLSMVNFQEVESMDVLKDGSAAAIYGTRGTNGVIIVTTKRARSGQTAVEYDGQVSVQSVLSRAVPMNATQFGETINKFLPDYANCLYGADTDWFKEVTRTPFSHRHTLSVSGGSEKFSHRTVANIERNQGMLRNNDRNKYMFRTNIHQDAIEGWLTLDYNLNYTRREYTGTRTGIFRQAFFHNPTEPVYNPEDLDNGGYFTIQAMDYYNPVAMLNERDSNTDVDKFGANARATLNILPVKGLKWDNFISYQVERYENRDYRTRYYPGETGYSGTAEISNSSDKDLQWESTLQYGNKFGQHSLQALLGYTYQYCEGQESYMMNYGFDVDFFKTNNMNAGAALKAGTADMSSYKYSSKYIAFFGRVLYNYADRYMVSVSLRRDGSSRFGDNNKWGWFPAVSAGWRISQENWMKNVQWLDELKLRAGYGVTGNQDFDNYKSLFLVKSEGSFYYNGKWSNAYAPASNANPNLAWERKSEFNVGIDYSVLRGRISGAIDYYYRKTTNLLYNYKVPVPPYDYEELFTNVGAICNSGIEFTINAIPVKAGKFEWNTSLVLAHNRNKLISFTNEEFQGQEYRIGWLNTPLGAYSQRLIEGESIGSFYGPEWRGLSSSGSDRLRQNDENEWVNLGCAYPFLTGGWSNTLRYGRLALSFTLRGSFGGKAFNQMRAVYENISNMGQQNVLASWLDNTDFIGKVTYSDKYLEDATFVKLDNVTVSYDWKFKNKYLHGLTLYATGQNLATITGYKGVDPEVKLTGLTPGIEPLSYYPRTRVFTLGVKLAF